MKIMLDTNILIDSVLPKRPNYEEANEIFRMGHCAEVQLAACSLSLKDVYYILCKQAGEPTARRFVKDLLESLIILNVDDTILKDAILSNEPDFEDGIVRACAEVNGIDFIITRDKQAYAASTVKSISSSNFCELVL